jgi:RHH-type transcriptional regulator, proline utilization regulon repressor / proline dehydrogenase / delta 1-pyrroline-5-carboxylate dehydrogenase
LNDLTEDFAQRLYAPARCNSTSIEWGEENALNALLAEIDAAPRRDLDAAPLIDGVAVMGPQRAVASPIDATSTVGLVSKADAAIAQRATSAASAGAAGWSATPVDTRAAALAAAADSFESERGRFIASAK